DSLVSGFLDPRDTDQNRHATTVLAEVLLLECLQGACHLHLFNKLCVASAPIWRREVCPAHATCNQILTLVSHHAKKRVVGLDDRASEINDENPYNVCVDQAPDFCFPVLQIGIQPSVFQ